MARKSSNTHPKPTPSDASPKKSATLKTSGTVKRKIDWATIDDGGDFTGFTLKAVTLKTPKKLAKTPNKKQKLDASAEDKDGYRDAPLDTEVLQQNPFPESELSEVHCKVEPAREWESTGRYRKFTISGEEFEVGQIVFVRKTAEAHDTPDAIEQWFAKVLEVRAGDASHVYLRVYWAYRPEDLPDGRQPHHGQRELIVSNHMDIIEALSVESIADVVHWDDDPDKLPDPDRLFWRQWFDISKPKSKPQPKLKTYCVDNGPFNPDEPLIHCASCSEWLHLRCLEEQAVKEAFEEYNVPLPQLAKAKGRAKDKKSTKPAFTAKVITTDPAKTRLVVTDHRIGEKDRQWDVEFSCLLCKQNIDKSDDDDDPREPVDEVGISVTTSPSKAKTKADLETETKAKTKVTPKKKKKAQLKDDDDDDSKTGEQEPEPVTPPTSEKTVIPTSDSRTKP